MMNQNQNINCKVLQTLALRQASNKYSAHKVNLGGFLYIFYDLSGKKFTPETRALNINGAFNEGEDKK